MMLYISGAISGIASADVHAMFEAAEELLEEYDFEYVNPLNVRACDEESCNDDNQNTRPGHVGYLHSWECYLKSDLREMLNCDGIIMLPNWRNSAGARLELVTAINTGLSVYSISPDMKSFQEVMA